MHESKAYPGLPKPLGLLIVDDEPRLRELLTDVAGDMGFIPAACSSAEEAFRMMAAEPRSIVVLDLNLPGVGGIEFLAAARDRWPATQVIILTGFGSLEAARKAVHYEAVEFLTKPCPLGEVEKALHRARCKIDRSRQQEFSVASPPESDPAGEDQTLQSQERRLILSALERNAGNRSAAARQLGISRRTLHYRLREYEREAPHWSA
jgi:DNA-binding NtrC family response regulator